MNHKNQPLIARAAADLIAFVPTALGFQPRESVAFVTMRGNTTGAVMRVDLPADTTPPADFAQAVTHYLLADTAADGVLLLIYTNEALIRIEGFKAEVRARRARLVAEAREWDALNAVLALHYYNRRYSGHVG